MKYPPKYWIKNEKRAFGMANRTKPSCLITVAMPTSGYDLFKRTADQIRNAGLASEKRALSQSHHNRLLAHVNRGLSADDQMKSVLFGLECQTERQTFETR